MLPAPPPSDPADLYRARDAVCVTDALVVAIAEMDLLTEIARAPATVSELAGRLGVALRPLDVLVTLLRAKGWVGSGEMLRCTPAARDHLVRGSPFYLGPYYASLGQRPQVRELVQVLRTDKPASWGGSAQPKAWVDAMREQVFAREFTAAMDCRGAYLAPALAAAVRLGGCRRLLDIAGGSGIYACALAEANPGLGATVLERVPMDDVARRMVTDRGYGDRVTVTAGDMLSDPYPADHDVHLLSNVLHDWDQQSVIRLLHKSAAALPAGGRLVIHDAHLNRDKSGPLEVAEYSVFLMHATVGRCYSVAELESWLGEAGFDDITHTPTAAHRSAVVAVRRG